MAIKQVTAVQAMEEISKGKIITASLNEMQGAWIALADCEDGFDAIYVGTGAGL